MGELILDNLNEILKDGNIIDNKRTKSLNMKDALNTLAKNSKSFKCSVGYFYISGLIGIIDSLKDLEEIKILMGYETNKPTKEELIKAFKENFDRLKLDEQTKSSMKLFYQLVKEYKNLKIRVYFGENKPERLHSKSYLFINDPSTGDLLKRYTAGIIGSSNLTPSGLVGNTELNTIITNGTDLEVLESWFDNLWDKGTEDFEKLKISDALRISIEKSKFKKEVEELEDSFHYIEPKKFFKILIKYLGADYLFEEYKDSNLFKFQYVDFIRVLNNFNSKGYRGCFLTSSVGLGKSYVAAQVAKYFIHNGEKVLVIAPAGLVKNKDHWQRYLKEFGIYNDVNLESMGKLQKNPSEFDLNKYSMDYGLIIVDEAHNYRNINSYRSKNLKDIIDQNGNSKCLFLTATPINTKIDDLINLIKLFYRKGQNLLFDKLIRDLSRAIKKLENSEYEELTDNDKKRLFEVQEEIEKEIFVKSTGATIKTSEEYIKELKSFTGIDIKNIPDPQVKEIKYILDSSYEKIIEGIVTFITGLSAAHLRLLDPDKGIRLGGIFKWLLYKRFESDITSYYLTLTRLYKKNSMIIKSVEKQDIKFLENEDGNEDDEEITFQINYKEKLTQIIDIIKLGNGKDYLNVLDDLKKDTELIKIEINKIKPYLKKGSKILFEKDQKIHQLNSIIEYNNKKNILIFTQYTDTIRAIKEFLGDSFSSDEIKFVDSNVRNKEKIIENFNDPNDKLRIIVTTDTLSEGFNISGADIVINFDIPYNPVRLIQRIGRATRLDTPKKIEVLNFRPADKIDIELKLVKTLELRIKDIIRFIGVEYRIWFEAEKELLAKRREFDKKIYLDILEKIRKNLREGDFDKLEIPLNYSKPILVYLQDAINKYEIKKDELKTLKIPPGNSYTTLKGKRGIVVVDEDAHIYNEEQLIGKTITEIKINSFEKLYQNELKDVKRLKKTRENDINQMKYFNDNIDQLVDNILDYINSNHLEELYDNIPELVDNLEKVRDKCGNTTESQLKTIKREIRSSPSLNKIDKLNKGLKKSFTKVGIQKKLLNNKSLFVIGFVDD
jgi:superfamily II DNA or RNA helicase